MNILKVLDTSHRDTDYFTVNALSVGRQLRNIPSDKHFWMEASTKKYLFHEIMESPLKQENTNKKKTTAYTEAETTV